ncbi:MAG: peptidyl-prolyl cis-trans isomerase, partial [Pseudomonadota bacterium]
MSTRRWSREPLLWFALLGLALFFFSRKEEFAAVEIQVSRDVITRLDDQWQMQMGRPASEQELDGLVSDWVREEIYAREAQSLGLDRDDTIIRRRLVQKLRFLTEDLALAEPPTEAALAAYFDEHANRYHIPDRIDFEHRYFSKDRREDATADAAAALAAMQNPEPVQTRELGDAFLLQREFFARSERQIS